MPHNLQDILAKRLLEQFVESEKAADLSPILSKLDDLGRRIERLEQTSAAAEKIPNVHPSRERFAIAEAIAAHELNSAQSEEKACQFEPNGKPCDHCAMCSARGF